MCLALILLLVALSPAQNHDANGNAQGVATMSVDVKVVTLPVIVRDKKGQIVRNLTKDDFVLQEDGRPQAIKYFTQDTNLPLTLGLLVDTSLSQRNVLDQERNASKVFLDQMLTDTKDKAFLIHFRPRGGTSSGPHAIPRQAGGGPAIAKCSRNLSAVAADDPIPDPLDRALLTRNLALANPE